MKTKQIVTIQVLFLIGAVVAGLLLKGNLADGPRMAHRLFGMLAGLTSLISLGVLVSRKASRQQLALASSALVFSLVAGAAGKSLKTASNYSSNFNVMRFSGLIALICAAALLSIVSKSVQQTKTKE